MKYLINESTDPYFNLAFDEYCLENIISDEPYFYLWRNRPAVIIGLNQNAQRLNLVHAVIHRRCTDVDARIDLAGSIRIDVHGYGSPGTAFLFQNGLKLARLTDRNQLAVLNLESTVRRMVISSVD